MVNLLSWVGAMLLFLVMSAIFVPVFPVDAAIPVFIFGGIISVAWGIVVISLIGSERTKHYRRFHRLTRLREDQKSLRDEMNAYIAAIADELTKTYKDFELRLSSDVKDSKLLAANMQDSSYHQVLIQYESRIGHYLKEIGRCDRRRNDTIADMKTAKQDTFEHGYFLPDLDIA